MWRFVFQIISVLLVANIFGLIFPGNNNKLQPLNTKLWYWGSIKSFVSSILTGNWIKNKDKVNEINVSTLVTCFRAILKYVF